MAPFRKHYIALIILNALAIPVTLYLSYLHYEPDASDICVLSEKWNCSIVNKSIYAELFGIPVSILGFVAYVAFLAFAIRGLKHNQNKLVPYFLLAVAGGTAFALYLTGIEAFVLQTFCLFCVIQQILILIELGVATHLYSLIKKSKHSLQ